MKTLFTILLALFFTLQLILAINIASAVTIDSVSVSPQEVIPGKSAEIRMVIDNHLDDDAEDVSVSLDLSKVPFAPEKTSEEFFDEIIKNKKRDVRFMLNADANAEPAVYKIPVSLSYKINNQSKTRITYISITVNAKPKLDLSISSFVLKNQKNKIQIQITNTGLAKASFLEMEIGQSNFNLLSGNKIYVGDLDSNDFDTLSFEAFVKDTQLVNIPLTIKYKDPSNREYEESISLTAKAYSQKEAENLGLIKKSSVLRYVLIVAVIIIIILVIRWRRKRVRNKANQV